MMCYYETKFTISATVNFNFMLSPYGKRAGV